jgi:hypothetical protein
MGSLKFSFCPLQVEGMSQGAGERVGRDGGSAARRFALMGRASVALRFIDGLGLGLGPGQVRQGLRHLLFVLDLWFRL